MKTRIVHTRMWEDEYFCNLSRASKLLFIYLITNSRINLVGVFEVSDRVIMFDTGLNSKELEESKKELFPKVRFFDGWAYLPNAQKLGGYKGGKNEIAIDKEWESVPTRVVEALTKTDHYTLSRKGDTLSSISDTPINHKPEIINHKSKIINQKEIEKNAEKFLKGFNLIRGTKYSSSKAWAKNFEFWLDEYSVEQMLEAVGKAKDDGFWADKLDPDKLFRTHEDRIGQLLNVEKQAGVVTLGKAKE